uniref:RT_RNaseH domain-containing protein n=1 Tax=Strongyloides papillosus TaxID=174720 RepID=A0A0N5BGN0_STREA
MGYSIISVFTFHKQLPYLKPLKDAENREKFQWLPNDELAFQKCKAAIRDAKILHSPNMATALSNYLSFTLCTDASGDAIGSVLLQNHKVVGFYSRTLKGVERNYVALDLEALAILSSLKHFKVLLYGLPITIITDHKPLTSFLTKKDLSARLTRWMIQLQAVQLNIVHSPGKENYVADCLSRCIQPEPISPQDDVEEFPEEHIIAIETTTAMLNEPWTNLPNRMEWSAFQESDNKLNQLMKAIKNDDWSILTSCPEMNFLLKQKSNLIINDKHQLTTKDGKLILSHTLANKVALFCHKNHESYSNI